METIKYMIRKSKTSNYNLVYGYCMNHGLTRFNKRGECLKCNRCDKKVKKVFKL
mgnify:CR=1 FL=1